MFGPKLLCLVKATQRMKSHWKLCDAISKNIKKIFFKVKDVLFTAKFPKLNSKLIDFVWDSEMSC